MTVCGATLISAIVPHHSFLGYIQGFLFILSAAMFCVAAIKGFALKQLMLAYPDLNISDPDHIKVNVTVLLNEKHLYLTSAYTIIGLSFFTLGIFSFLTMKIRLLTGILAFSTGSIIIVFTLFIPDSLLEQIGLSMACLMFFILTIQFFFRGLTKKQKKFKEVPELVHES
jgi:hypothetical protein